MANVFDQFDAMSGGGNVFDQFDAAVDPEQARRAELDAQVRREMAMSPEEFEATAREQTKQGLPYRAQPGKSVSGSLFGNLTVDPFGLRDEISGAGQYVRALVGSGFDTGKAAKAYSDTADIVRAEQRVGREEHGIVPELVGGLGTVGAKTLQAAAQAPTFLKGAGQSAVAGGAFGGATGFAQGEGGVGDRAVKGLEGAATGALVAPAISHVAVPVTSRLIGATKDAAQYAGRALQNARNPEQAAINNVADRMVTQGIDPAAVRAQVSPPPSSQLAQRNFTEDDLATIVSRGLKGEKAADIANNYGIHESTVNRYLAKYRDANPTERNIIDISKDLAGDGKAAPLTRLGRAAYGLSEDGEAAQRLITRQQTQAGRVSNVIDRSGAGRNFDDEIARLDDVLSTQSKAAYAAADQNAQPFDLRPVISKYRRAAFGRAGELRDQMDKAVDMFFFNPGKALTGPRRLGQPITDLKRFQAARQSLDQTIARSMQDGKPTPLTRQLTKLRQDLTSVVRAANKELAAADDLFSGAKTSEKLLEQGERLSTRLGAPSRQLLDGFEKLKPEQQELVRLGFLRKLQDMAANVRDGGAVANQFNSPAVRSTIERRFHRGEKGLRERGQRLIKELQQEATTTRTKNEVLVGSRTAEYGLDMEKAQQGARAAADLVTGQVWKMLGNLTTRLTSQIGEKGSKEVLEVLTQTDPAKLLPILNRLAAAAKSTQERQAYVAALRELRAINSPAVSAVTGQQMGRQEQPNGTR